MVGHGGSSAGSYLADPTSPIPSHCASIVATSTLRVNPYMHTETPWKMKVAPAITRLPVHSTWVPNVLTVISCPCIVDVIHDAECPH